MPLIVYSYIVRELTPPFLLSAGILTATMLLTKVMKLVEFVVAYGAGAGFVAKFILFLLPSLLIYIIPVSFLVAVLVSFGRLSSDNEVTALKAAGVGVSRLFPPVALMAALLYGVTLVFSLYAFPWGNMSIRRQLYDAAKNRAGLGLKENTFTNAFKGVVMYAGRILPEEDSMEGIFIYDTREGENGAAITAGKGEFLQDPDGLDLMLRLYNGSIHASRKDGVYRIASFGTYDLSLNLMESDAKDPVEAGKRNKELYLGELFGMAEKAGRDSDEGRDYMMEAHKRFSLPASIFVFSLIGVPLGIQRVRSPGLAGFSSSIVVVAFYFILSLAMDAAGSRRVLPLEAAAWGPNAVTGLFGAYVFYREAKDAPIRPLVYMEDRVSRLSSRIKGLFR